MVMGDSPLSCIERTMIHNTSPKLFDSFGIPNSQVPDNFVRNYNFSTSYKPPLKEIKRTNEGCSIIPTIDHEKQYQLHDESEQFDIVQIISNYSQHNCFPVMKYLTTIPVVDSEECIDATSSEPHILVQSTLQKDSESTHSVHLESRTQSTATTITEEVNSITNVKETREEPPEDEKMKEEEEKVRCLDENLGETIARDYQSFIVNTQLVLGNEEECEDLDIPNHTNAIESPEFESQYSISPDSIQYSTIKCNYKYDSNANYIKPQPGKRGRKRKNFNGGSNNNNCNNIAATSVNTNHTVTDFKNYDIWNPLIFPSATPGTVSPFISTPPPQNYVSFGIPPHVRGNKTENIAELFNSIVKHTSFMNRISPTQQSVSQPTSKITQHPTSILTHLDNKSTVNPSTVNEESLFSNVDCNGKYKIDFALKAFKRINGNQPWVESNIAPPMIGKMRKITLEFGPIPVPLKLNITITPISTKGNQSKLVISESNRVYKKCHKNEGSDKVSYYFEPSKVKQIKTFYLKPRWVCFGPRKERPEFRVVISVANANKKLSSDITNNNSNLSSSNTSPFISQTKSIVDPSKFHYNEDINNSITTVIFNISSAPSSGSHGEIPSPSNLNLSAKEVETLKTRLKLSLLDYGKALGLPFNGKYQNNNNNNNNNNSNNYDININNNNNNNNMNDNINMKNYNNNHIEYKNYVDKSSDSMEESDESENEIDPDDDETDEDLDAAESIEALTGLKRSREEIEDAINENIFYNGQQKLSNNTDFQRDVDANDIILHAWKTEIHCHKMESSIRGKLMDNYHPPSSLSDCFYL